MTKALLLFDIDGTLLKTGGAGMRAMDRVGRKLFGERFNLDRVQVSGHLDPLIFAEAAAVCGLDEDPSHHDLFRDHYIDQLQQELLSNEQDVHPAQGVHDTLALLRRRAVEECDVVLGLLTGNYTRAVPIKLNAVGIDPQWFEVTAFGDEAVSRAALVEVAMAKYRAMSADRLEPGRVVIIGDTPRDVACAHAHGCVAFAVATGSYGADELREAGADIVVSNLEDPTPLIELVGMLTT